MTLTVPDNATATNELFAYVTAPHANAEDEFEQALAVQRAEGTADQSIPFTLLITRTLLAELVDVPSAMNV